MFVVLSSVDILNIPLESLSFVIFIYDINIDNKGIYRRIKFKYSFEDNNKFCDNLK